MKSTMIIDNGTKFWYNDKDQVHRLDGPAVEWGTGTKFWRVDGKEHRLNGPALVWVKSIPEWYIDLSISYDPIMDNA